MNPVPVAIGRPREFDEVLVTQTLCKACAPTAHDVQEALRPVVSRLQNQAAEAENGGGS